MTREPFRSRASRNERAVTSEVSARRIRASSSASSSRRGWLRRSVVRTVSRVTPAGTLCVGTVGETVAVSAGVAVDEAVAAVAAGVSDGDAVAVSEGPGVDEDVAEAGDPGASAAVGVAVAVCSAGAAWATSASPVRRPTLFGSARAISVAWRTNARREIRSAHARFILVVERITV
jgi:hypothetical protein